VQYRHCSFEKDNTKRVGFIPHKFAVVGWTLRIREEDGTWSEGWVVTRAGPIMKDVPDYHKVIRQHRRRTGDSLPKQHGNSRRK